MSDWTEELAAAEADAERFQAAESEAEDLFHVVRAKAEASGDPKAALDSREFQRWMTARRATDLAWGSWSLLKDDSAA
jgi:hypothetical protein